MCRDALDLCHAPGRNQGPWGSEQDRSSSPLLPSEEKPQLLANFFLPSCVLWRMPVCNVLYLSQKRVVWLRLRQERLQTGWDGFQGAETMTISPARPSLRGDGRLLCPHPLPSPAGQGEPPHCEGFFTSDGFSERDFRAGATETETGPDPPCRGTNPQRAVGHLCPGISLRPCWDVPVGSWHLQGRRVKQPTLGHGSPPPHGSSPSICRQIRS